MKYVIVIVFCLLQSKFLHAQPLPKMPEIPLARQIFHDNISKTQQLFLHLKSNEDTIFKATQNPEINSQLTHILINKIKELQWKIETDSIISVSDKYRWLRGINEMLLDYLNVFKAKKISGLSFSDLFFAYEKAMSNEIHHHTTEEVLNDNELEISSILSKNFALKNSFNPSKVKEIVFLKSINKNPNNILTLLKRNLSVYCVDSLIGVAAHRNPEEFYNYASANDPLAKKIQSTDEPLVKVIATIANKNTGRSIFPFLDDIYHNKITIDSISKIIDDNSAYFKLLVATEISYAGRLVQTDTPLVMKSLTQKLRTKSKELFVDEVNGLHEQNNEAIRFKSIDSLSSEELYYLCVLCEDEIYTSSYLGIYKRIIERLNGAESISLLNCVNFDYYRKFIKMASAYNTLDHFLKRMYTNTAEELMKKFVRDLEKNGTLEDAVDVADSYASINDDNMRKLVNSQVKASLELNIENKNQKGVGIYHLLDVIFRSIDTSAELDITSELGIPPIYYMPNKLLKDTLGKIIIRQFFYGDKDGMDVFLKFKKDFQNEKWKIINKSDWIEVRSTAGTPVVIYANKPLDELKDLDRIAQSRLTDYLDSLDIYPTVIIHRGHSYHVKSTIKQIPFSANVILLGSCGGYQSLNTVLNICPEAHIIASKQVGTGQVNEMLINTITELLRNGKDLNWPSIWKTVSNNLKGNMKERFDDYIPPYKNLGAIFIMAYNKWLLNEKK